MRTSRSCVGSTAGSGSRSEHVLDEPNSGPEGRTGRSSVREPASGHGYSYRIGNSASVNHALLVRSARDRAQIGNHTRTASVARRRTSGWSVSSLAESEVSRTSRDARTTPLYAPQARWCCRCSSCAGSIHGGARRSSIKCCREETRTLRASGTLERDHRRKEKALAEAAALRFLKKKGLS